ncbi:type II toxin-antitoxin system HicB family antitoxin [Allosphingosinicella sp.]|uniref:type II toxin-antitoxin system HicB family antitoxin n=1 Tax=Allosphingosinicella sp. TaxID=2823234 RepID=UPI002F1A88FD
MLSYPVRFIPTEDGSVLVRFPDVPEAAAVGADEDEALEGALHVLESVLSAYCVDGRAIPAPSDICGAPTVATDKFSILGMEVPDA